MANIKFKNFKFSSFDEQKGTVEGYASKFGVIDQVNDVVMPGAFKKSLEGGAKSIRFLWQHDRSEPIGIFTELKEDANGLSFTAQFANTQRAQEARELMKMGAIDSFSIGYVPVKEEQGVQNGRNVNMLKEVRLFEISAVTFPCNTEAKLNAIKSELDDAFAGLSLEDQALAKTIIDTLVEKHVIIRGPDEQPKLEPVTTSDEDEKPAEEAVEEAAEEVAEEAPEEEKQDDSLDAIQQLRNELAIKRLRDTLKGK